MLDNSSNPVFFVCQPVQTDAQIIFDTKLSYEHPPCDPGAFPVAGSADAWARAPIGCGPYVFDHWEAGSEIVLKKNDKFWGDEPTFNSITFKFIPDANARTLALQSHDIDFAENIGASLAPTLQGVDGIQLFYSDIGETQVIWFNNLDNEALAKPEVRKALEYATNKRRLLSFSSS